MVPCPVACAAGGLPLVLQGVLGEPPPGWHGPRRPAGSPRVHSPQTPRSSTGGFEAGSEGGRGAPGEKADVYGVNQHESQGSFEDGEASVAELQR